ncbi:MAG: sulfurtransferase [Candidatus Hydrogenedentes bacterium]|nr:sulfurtransferase [Candidatus Hydrogenedentota bacterium]
MSIVAMVMSGVLTAVAPLLVSTGDLAELKEVCIVDAGSPEDFAAGHIPNAIHLHADVLSETRGSVKGLLKSLEQLYQIVGDAGVDPQKHVVVYGDMANPEKRVQATRLFLVFQYIGFPRVSLLDGGIGKWKNEGREIASGEAKANKVAIQGLQARPELIVGHAEVAETLKGDEKVVLDMRPAAFYTGEKIKDYVTRKGHIVGAGNLPNDDLFTGPDFVFKSVEELGEVYGRKGIDKDTPLITYCNSGQAATVGYFGALLLGNDSTAVYDGSMAEWSQLKDAPISTKPEQP